MLRNYLLLFSFFFALTVSAKVQTEKISVHFQTDKYELSENARQQLEQLYARLKNEPDFMIRLEGHTDDVGAFSYNDQLSVNRSNAVRDYLIKLGMDEGMVEVASFGERRPEIPNVNDESRKTNRRVDMYLTIYHFDSLEELEASLKKSGTTEFEIDPSQKNVLAGKQGVRMLVEPGSFIDKDGNPVTEEVKLTLNEAVGMGDFLKYKLATVAGDRILVSGGMMKLTAETMDGEPVDLNPDQPIRTAINAGRVERDMWVFTSETGSNWDITEQAVSSGLNLNIPPKPRLENNLTPLPEYHRDMSRKPQEPDSRGKPRLPRAPDREDYEPEIKWYQFPFKRSIERNAENRYQAAMARYEKKIGFYQKRYDLFVEHNSEYPRQVIDYRVALKEWNEQCVADSIALLNSAEYNNIKLQNRRRAIIANKIWQEELAEWEEIRNERLEELAQQMDEMGIQDEGLAYTYFFNMPQLSWINVDRFMKLDASETRTITLIDDDKKAESVFLVFNDLKCVLPMDRDHKSDFYKKSRVPNSEKVTILAYKVVDGKTWVYREAVNPKVKRYQMDYKPYTYVELQKLMQKIQS